MQEKKYGTGDGFTDWAIVILSLILFARTADVLSYFSPPLLSDLIGWDVAWIYGMVTAFFVEGVALAFHFNHRAKNHAPAQIVKWILLAISGACQVFDGNIILGTLSQMPEAQRMGFQVGVPLLPLFVVVLLFFVGHLPDGEVQVVKQPRVGMKTRIDNSWNRFWYGDRENTRVLPKALDHPEPEPEPEPSNNGLNPTSRRS